MRTIVCSLALAALMLAPVAPASAESSQDRQAAQKVADSMKQSGLLKDYRVGVKCSDEEVWLMGSVTDAKQKLLAEMIADKNAGGRQVISKLEIESPEMPAVQTPKQDKAVQLASKQAAKPLAALARSPSNAPRPYARRSQNIQAASYSNPSMGYGGGSPMPAGHGQVVSYDSPQMPGYAWPSYASHPNYAALTYPKQYSPSAWPYIGPFYPYPQVPLGWRKVTLEWDDGWWFLDFKDQR